MSLNESTIEAAALEWFSGLGYALGHGPHLAPGEPAAERDSFGDVVLAGRLRAMLPRPKPAVSSHAFAVLLPKLTDRIRGSVKQGTLGLVSPEDTKALRSGIRRWLAGPV